MGKSRRLSCPSRMTRPGPNGPRGFHEHTLSRHPHSEDQRQWRFSRGFRIQPLWHIARLKGTVLDITH